MEKKCSQLIKMVFDVDPHAFSLDIFTELFTIRLEPQLMFIQKEIFQFIRKFDTQLFRSRISHILENSHVNKLPLLPVINKRLPTSRIIWLAL